jgi:hypothetical protein
MQTRFDRLLRAGASALILTAALAPLPSHAAKVMGMEADDMVRAASHVKDMLGLTPNQQTLWQQVTSRSSALLRIRQSRREKLQSDLKSKLTDPRGELRDLDAEIEAEAALSATENKELRALWLTVNDALTDPQRQTVAQFLLTQLERVDAPERPAGPERGEAPQGGRHHKQDGAGGPPRF